MNQRQSLTTAVAIVLAVIIAASGMSLVGSYVLCVGSDGHTALELALGVCCINEDTSRWEAETSTALVDSCGGCADIGLDASSLTEGRQRLAPPHSADIDVAGQVSATAGPMLDTGRGAESGPPHLEELQTVVLQT